MPKDLNIDKELWGKLIEIKELPDPAQRRKAMGNLTKGEIKQIQPFASVKRDSISVEVMDGVDLEIDYQPSDIGKEAMQGPTDTESEE